jgi:hypothetical protein
MRDKHGESRFVVLHDPANGTIIDNTFEGRDIPVYKISAGADVAKQALVGQPLIHAREWQSGASVFYNISGLLDALQANEPCSRC